MGNSLFGRHKHRKRFEFLKNEFVFDHTCTSTLFTNRKLSTDESQLN